MLAVRLDPKMEKELEQLAAATGRSKRFYVYPADTDFRLSIAADDLEVIGQQRAQLRGMRIEIREELGLGHNSAQSLVFY